MFRLKKGQESFTPVEGPFAGRSFAPGQFYGEIPPGTAGKFEEIGKTAPAKAPAAGPVTPAKADSKKAVFAPPPSEKGRR